MFKCDSIMDCGYFIGGNSNGLMYFPSSKKNDSEIREPFIIPWENICKDEDVITSLPDKFSNQVEIA